MGRRRRDNTLSLFAFQDIITGVAGVMLFILLLLVVQLTLRAATPSSEFGGVEANAAEPIPDPLPPDDREKLRQMQQELEQQRQRSAALLRADASDLDAEMASAEAELDELMGDAAEKKSQAEAMQSQMSSEETSQQKSDTIKQRNALRRELEDLEDEQTQHAGGKLVAFKAASAGIGDLWIIDMRATSATIFNVESPRNAVTVSYQRFQPAMLTAASIRKALQEQTKTRNVVVLLRPSIAGTGPELLDAFRQTGLRVALELLDEDTLVTRPSEDSK